MSFTENEMKELAKIAFPSYRGRKFRFVQRAAVDCYDVNWNNGSRSQYVLLDVNTKFPLWNSSRIAMMFPGTQSKDQTLHKLAPNTVMVRESIFMGKNVGLTVFFPPPPEEESV